MGSSSTSTLSERWEALQQLEAAYNQPDGNMFFTYNGNSYRSTGINADGTMRVIDQTTGQLLNLDPVDVYTSARAAEGDPLPPKPTPKSTLSEVYGPSTASNVMGQIGTYSGLVNMAAQIHAVHVFLDKIPQFFPALGALTTVLSAYSEVLAINAMFKNGFTWGGLLGAGGSALGIATGVNTLVGSFTMYGGGFTNPVGWAVAAGVISASVLYNSINSMILKGVTPGKVATAAISTLGLVAATNFAIAGIGAMAAAAAGTSVSFSSLLTTALLTGPWGWVAAAVIVAFAVIWSLLHKPPPEQVAAQNLTQALNPVVWVQGPLAVVAVGTAAILMGWAKTATPPAMATLTVPAYYVNQVLASQGVSNVDLKSKTPTVLVEPGDGRVVIVSPQGTDSKGNPLVSLQTYVLSKNLQFISSNNAPSDGAYIPFFQVINGSLKTHPNPALTQALEIQEKMLQAVLSQTLGTHDALNALNIAAVANKSGVSPSN